MPDSMTTVPDELRQWFELRHPGNRLEFNDVSVRTALDFETLAHRRIYSGWFVINPTADVPVEGGPVRFFQAFVSPLNGAVSRAVEHRPRPREIRPPIPEGT